MAERPTPNGTPLDGYGPALCAHTEFECDCGCRCGDPSDDCYWPHCGCGCAPDCVGCRLVQEATRG